MSIETCTKVNLKNRAKQTTTPRPTITLSLTLFADQLEYIDRVAGSGYRDASARLLLDLAKAAEQEGKKKKK